LDNKMSDSIVLMPAFNEADLIATTVQSVLKSCPFVDICVIDDGSTDETARCAREAGAKVLQTSANLGKGGALNFGLANVTNYDVVAFIDADLGECAGQVVRLIEAVQNREADMVIAGFPPAKNKGGFGFVKRLARDGIMAKTGASFNSPISGQRAMRQNVITKIAPIEDGYGAEVAMTIDALLGGFTVIEIPLEMRHRETGRNLKGFLHRGRQYFDIRRALAKRR
jgi:glycosyltransferase involved in cell wall biosynthesis